MIKNSSKQTGSVHVIIIVVLVVALLGTLGFVFWQNFMKPKPVSNANNHNEISKKSLPSASKSGVVVLENGDMNKYVNYENGFEFLLPKQISTYKDCESTDRKFDNYGNSTPSESHYGTSSGAVSVIVIESNNEYIMAPSKTVVLSSPKGTPEAGYIYKACDVLDTTADLITETEKDNFGIKNIAMDHNLFRVETANNKEEALKVARNIFNDQTGTVDWKIDSENTERERGEFVYTPSPDRVGGAGYRLWYYPKQKKTVYISLGQSVSFQSTKDQKEYYMPGIESTFKFKTD